MKHNYRKKPSLVVFRQWGGKKYSAFNSLKKVIKIGCLAITYLTFANPGVAQTKENKDGVAHEYSLESVEITGEQPPEAYSSIARVVVTITQKEIEQAAVSSVNELLEYAANIDIRQRGVNGVQADISIRGGSFDQVLILLNGVNITDPQTGHYNLNLPLDLSVIERIEILKGPGAWRFGPGAFSGAINIVTKAGESPFIKAEADAGQYNLYEAKVSAGLRQGDLYNLISANYSQTDGYTNNTDSKISNLFYQGDYKKENSSIDVQFGYTTKAYGANSFYSAKYPNQYEELQTLFGSIGAKTTANKLSIEPKVYYRRNNDRFLLIRDQPGLYSNYHTTDVWGTNVLGAYVHGSTAVSTLGVDVRTETIWSNNLGESTTDTVYSPVNDTIVLDHFHTRTNFSAFVGHKHYFGKLTVNAGLNFTRNTDQKMRWFIYPGVDINYAFSEKSSLSASANKTMRMPTYTDLYYHGAQNQGNSDLEPEEALGYEIGYEFKSKTVQASATAFYSHGKNIIDWVRASTDDIWETVNYTELNTSGIELNGKTDLTKLFPDQKFFRRISASYTYLIQDKPATNLISNYSLNYLKHRFDFDVNHKVWKNISANWHVAYQHRNGQYEKIIDKVSQGMTNFDPFTTIDLKLYWEYNRWNVCVSATNILNKEYYDYGNIQQPGRWIKAGVSKKIDFN